MFIPLHLLLLIASPPQIPPCVQELSALLQREDFDAILTGAESCDQETGHPRAFYFKGIAQLAKGQPDRAIDSLQRYLASDPQGEPPRLREIAAVRLEQARSEVGVIEFRIEPDSSSGDTLVTIEREGWDEPIARFASKFEQRDGRAILVVPPGSYRVTARRAGFLPGRQEISIAAGGETVSVQLSLRLRPPPVLPKAPEPPKFPQGRWAGAWSGVGGGMAVAGISTVVVGRASSRVAFDRCTTSEGAMAGCQKDLANATMLQAGGGGMLGAGLGMMVGGLTGLAPSERGRRIGWTAEVSVGGALVVVGLIFLGVSLDSFSDINENSVAGRGFEERITPSARGFIAGSAMLGAGLGLGLSATFGLMTTKFSRRRPQVAARLRVLPDGFAVRF